MVGTFLLYSVNYLGVTFDKKITWRLHIEMVTTNTYSTFIRLHFLFKIERLSTHFKLTLHKGLITSVTTYVCPA
jgi:hypothetical protein